MQETVGFAVLPHIHSDRLHEQAAESGHEDHLQADQDETTVSKNSEGHKGSTASAPMLVNTATVVA